MKIDTTTLLLIGGAAVLGWCFFMGPCKEWLNKLKPNEAATPKGASIVAKNVVADFQPLQAPGSAVLKGAGANYGRYY